MTPLINTAQPNPAPIGVPGVAQASNSAIPQMSSAPSQGSVVPPSPDMGTAPQPVASPIQQAQQLIMQNRQQGIPDSVSMQQLQQQGLTSTPPKPVTGGDITRGVEQSVSSTAAGLVSLGGAIGNWVAGNGFQSNAEAGSVMDRWNQWNKPQNSGQVAGNVIGDIAQFALPAGEVAKGASALSAGVDALNLAEKYGQAGELATQILKYSAKPVAEGIQGGIQTGLQQQSAKAGLEAAPAFAAGSAVFDALNAGGKNVISRVAKTFMGDASKGAEDAASAAGAETSLVSTSQSGGLKQKVTNFVKEQIEQDWRDILNLPASVTNAETKSGKNVVSLLTDAGMKPDAVNDGRAALDGTIQEAKTHALAADKALSVLLSTEQKVLPASKILEDASAELRSTGTNLEQAKEYLKTQLGAFIKQDGNAIPGAADGGVQMHLKDWNSIKGNGWTNVVDFGDPAKSIKNDVNNAIARSIKKNIEENVTNLDIKALNSHIGDWWHAVDILQQRNGAKVVGRGLTKALSKSAGAVAGTILTHGLGGFVGGDIVGGKIASFLTDSLLPMDIKMSLLKKLGEDPETAPLVKQAWDLVNKRSAEAAGRLKLPAPLPEGVGMDTPNVPPSGQGQVPARGQNVIYAGPPTGSPVQGSMQGDVPRPDIAQGAGMYVEPRTKVKVGDSVKTYPKIRVTVKK